LTLALEASKETASANWQKAELSQKDAQQESARSIALEKEVETLRVSLAEAGKRTIASLTTFSAAALAAVATLEKEAKTAAADNHALHQYWAARVIAASSKVESLERALEASQQTASANLQKAELSQKEAQQALARSITVELTDVEKDTVRTRFVCRERRSTESLVAPAEVSIFSHRAGSGRVSSRPGN
jgi:hypothetical protein